MSGERHEVRARVSPEAYRGIVTFCEQEGATLTALVEACGRLLDSGQITLPPEFGVLARRIDAERRSRRLT